MNILNGLEKRALVEGDFPLAAEQISPPWINEVLRHSDGKEKVQSVELQPIIEGYGIIGDFSKVKLQYNNPNHAGPDSVFPKFSSDNELSRFLNGKSVFSRILRLG